MAIFLQEFNEANVVNFLADKKLEITQMLILAWRDMKSSRTRQEVRRNDGTCGIDAYLYLSFAWDWGLLIGNEFFSIDYNSTVSSSIFLDYDFDEVGIALESSELANSLISDLIDEMYMQ